MKSFKKVSIALVFVIAVALLFVPVSYTLREPYDYNMEHRNRITGFYAEPDHSLDIVTLGSSAAFRYVNNPYLWKEYGYTSYNFCTPSQTIYAYEYLIDEVRKTQNPDLFIIDARQFLTKEGNNQREETLRQLVDNMKYSGTRISIINKMIDDWSKRLEFYFDIILYHGNWEQLTFDDLEYADNERTHELKGWRVAVRMNNVKLVDVTDVTEEMAISEDMEAELLNLLKKCQEEDVKVLFLSTPWAIDEEQQMKSNYVARIVEEHGYEYLDCNLRIDEMDLDPYRDFYNDRHANGVGSEKMSRLLGDFLDENYNINKEHEEAVVTAWNEMLIDYDAQMQELMVKYEERGSKKK